MERLKHVIPDESYRDQAREYILEHRACGSHMNGAGSLDKYLDDYDGWLVKLNNDRIQINNGERVPSETYMLVRESDNRLIGMCNIRLELNDRLIKCGGNIGYGIRPSERGKGYNNINLYLALLRCNQVGLDVVLLDCDNDNIASWKTMEALGGIEINRWYSEEEKCLCRRYSINVRDAINNYGSIYESKIRSR